MKVRQKQAGLNPSPHKSVEKTPVTVREVAERAGVSQKTVSRVINEEPYVSEDVRDRVQNAIAALNYIPNVRARRLRNGRSSVLALVYQSTRMWETSGWMVDVENGAIERAADLGYEVMMHPSRNMSADEQERIMRLVGQGSVDGLILTVPHGGQHEFTERLLERGIPFVAVGPPTIHEAVPSYNVADKQGTSDLVEYLIQQGHRRIGFIIGSRNCHGNQERFSAYKETLARHGIEFDPALATQGNSSFEAGLVNGRILFRLHPMPTAICASTDEAAAGVIQAAHQAGLSVPEDISVAGHDDIFWAGKITPPLTTVRQPMKDMAAAATETLTQWINGTPPAPPLYREFPATLIVRESTAPPRRLSE